MEGAQEMKQTVNLIYLALCGPLSLEGLSIILIPSYFLENLSSQMEKHLWEEIAILDDK